MDEMAKFGHNQHLVAVLDELRGMYASHSD
jgi:hypothetical protein